MSTATETGGGRAPSSPLQLSWREWLDVFKRAGKQFMADDCMGLGQQVAFSSLLAFLPTVILLIGLLGLFGNGAFDSLEQFVGSVAPHGVISMIDLAKQDAAQNKSGSAIAFGLGVVAALWAATGAIGRADQGGQPRLRPDRDAAVLEAAPDRARARHRHRARARRDVPADRLRRRRSATRSCALRPRRQLQAVLEHPPLADRVRAVLLFFALVYYLAPNMPQRSWKWITPGSIVGALLWLVLSGLFALYVAFASSYSKTYGSLAGAMILLLWLNYSAWAILFGAELNAELDRQADIHAAGGAHAGLVEPGAARRG